MQVFGNPFVNRKESLLRIQGLGLSTTSQTILTDVFTIKNADRVNFTAEALNVNFTISLRKTDASGNRVYTNANTPVDDIVLFDDITATLAGGRRAYEALFPDGGVDILDMHSHYKLLIIVKADTAYVPPTPTVTGVAGLYNSSLIVKDELAPLLIIGANYINHKP